MTDRTWKAAERRFAADVGVRRRPVTGERAGVDVGHAPHPFRYQIKHRRRLPAWLWAWLEGIREAAAREQATGVLVLSRPRRPRRDALVVLTWGDWVAWHGGHDDQAVLSSPHGADSSAHGRDPSPDLPRV